MRALTILLFAILSVVSTAASAQARVEPVPAGDFVLGPGDVINVSVWKQPALSIVLPVAPDGSINYPLIGRLRAAGLTVKQLEQALTERLREHVRDAQVGVTLAEAHSYRVYVLGEVARPGEFEAKGPVTVLQAIAMAGGFTAFASRNKVLVVSRGDSERRRAFDYEAYVSGKPDVINFVLAPGDTVVVK